MRKIINFFKNYLLFCKKHDEMLYKKLKLASFDEFLDKKIKKLTSRF